jgi:serine protease Do/serine protease DegQ
LVNGVQPGSPAEKAGMREGDTIVAMNGRAVRGAPELRARLGLTPVGEEVELRVLRGSETRSVRMRIAPPQDPSAAEGQAIAQLPGMSVVEIERGSPLHQRLRGGGLIVSAVEPESRAHQAGFRAGDIIVGVNRRRVQTVAEFQAIVRAAQGGYAVSLLRGDFSVTILVR